MNAIFLDRDGTLIREPDDFRIDSLQKLTLLPHVIGSLKQLQDAGYSLVIVSNQDGLGSDEFPQADFDVPQAKMLELFTGEGVQFVAVFVDGHYAHENHPNRKPGTGMVDTFVAENKVNLAGSYMVGDRKTDALFARNLGVQSLTIKDPLSNDGDARCADVPVQPTTTFTEWRALTQHILRKT